MDPEKLEQRIENKIPDSKKHLKRSPLLGTAIYANLKELLKGSSNLSDDEADRQAIERLEELHLKYTVTPGLRLTPTDMLFGEALVMALAPKVEGLRRERPGGTKPPFTTVKKATEWIEWKSEQDLAAWREKSKEREKAIDEIKKLADEHLIEFDLKFACLPYQKPDEDHVKNVPVVPGTYLRKLAQETALIAKSTGLPQDALVIHVLTGLKPIRSRAPMKTTWSFYNLPSGEQLAVYEAAVTFHAQDLTDEELRKVYNNVRHHLGGKSTKGLEHKDVEVWKIVQGLGGPPQQHGGKGPFWKEVLEIYVRGHPDEPYTSPNWAKKHYFKAAKRLSPP